MGAPVKIKNAIDAWTDQSSGKGRPNTARLRTRAGSTLAQYSWMYFNRSWPDDARIISAKLQFWTGSDLGVTSTTMSSWLADKKWSLNRIAFGNQPAITGAVASQTKANGGGPDIMWELDVKDQLQSAASTGDWFGFRISTNRGISVWIHSSKARRGKYRPVLVVEWMEPLEEPDNPNPAGLQAVNDARPVLSYDYSDPMGDFDLVAQRIAIAVDQASAEAEVFVYDSGEVATTKPVFDLETSTYPGLSPDMTRWWVAKAKDGISGEWSGWMEPAGFTRITKGALTILTDAITEGSPTVSWTFTGRTQQTYQVAIALADTPNDWLWDSGPVTSTATSHVIPFGVIKDAGEQYVITVRIWDDVDRVATPGDPEYVQQKTAVLPVEYAAGSELNTLSMAPDPMLPIARLNFKYTAERITNPGFETGSINPHYVTANVFSASLVAVPDTGANALQMNTNAIVASARVFNWNGSEQTGQHPATSAGETWTAKSRVRRGGGAGDVALYILWYDQAGVFISSNFGGWVTLTTAYQDLSVVDAVSPADGARPVAALYVQNASGNASGGGVALLVDNGSLKRSVAGVVVDVPDYFQVLRSEDNTNWEYLLEVVGSDALTGGDDYQIVDPTTPSYKQVYWRVVPVIAGVQGDGEFTQGQVRRLAPWLYRPDGTDACCFLNPKRDRKFRDIQELHDTMSGKTILVTQRLGKRAGTIEGRFTGDGTPGIDADEMLARFLRLRKDSGMPMVVSTANETINAVVYNFWYDVITDSSGITYAASADWAEV